MICSPNLAELIGGFILSIAIAGLGYTRGALSGSGVAGGIVTGTLICGFGGWEWGVLLAAFFASSSMLSFHRARDKRGVAEEFAKGRRRDLGQALANGGVAAVLAVLSRTWPHPMWFVACAGAVAAVNADTWATELGVLSREAPRLITNGRRVQVGSSGGVTWLGFLASLGGALLIGLLGGMGSLVQRQGVSAAGVTLLAAAAGGSIGCVCDSILGATVQAIYWCDACAKETERRVHSCGGRARLLRGWRWLGNDLVNFMASVAGALAAVAIGWRLS